MAYPRQESRNSVFDFHCPRSSFLLLLARRLLLSSFKHRGTSSILLLKIRTVKKNILWCAQFQSVQYRADNHWTDWNEIQTQTVPQFTNSRTNTREQNVWIRSKSFEMINKLDGDLIISSLLLWLTLEVTSISAFIFVAIYVWRMAFGLLRIHYKIIQFEWD